MHGIHRNLVPDAFSALPNAVIVWRYRKNILLLITSKELEQNIADWFGMTRSWHQGQTAISGPLNTQRRNFPHKCTARLLLSHN
jgi:hypothetical protein